MLSVIPAVNMISNIGFRADATHTPVPNRYAAMKTEYMDFPLIHPAIIDTDCAADAYSGKSMFREPSLIHRAVAAFRGGIL
jgi:hypothetical protein